MLQLTDTHTRKRLKFFIVVLSCPYSTFVSNRRPRSLDEIKNDHRMAHNSSDLSLSDYAYKDKTPGDALWTVSINSTLFPLIRTQYPNFSCPAFLNKALSLFYSGFSFILVKWFRKLWLTREASQTPTMGTVSLWSPWGTFPLHPAEKLHSMNTCLLESTLFLSKGEC